MLKRHEIQVLTETGRTQTVVAEIAGVSERTVRRIAQEAPVSHVDDTEERRLRGVGRPSKTDRFRKFVEEVLEREPDLKSVEILRRVRREGYTGGKSAVYELIRTLRPKSKSLVTRFEGLPGEFTQHDFGEVRVTYDGGVQDRVTFFATRWKYSRWAQVTVVPDQTTESLVKALVGHFADIGGVPLLAVFDRPKTVVLKWKKDGDVTEYNPVFAQAMFEMGVGVELCWPYRPNEKGAVENLVGWVKGSFFKTRRFADREDLLIQLAEWHHEVNHVRPSRATDLTPATRMVSEVGRLRPLRIGPDELALRYPVSVGPTAMVTWRGCQYSMPPEAIHVSGTLFLYRNHVRIIAGKYEAIHPRLGPDNPRSTLPEHRAQRVAAVSGKRARHYLMRQDILDVGDIAVVLLNEIVHRAPRGWYGDVVRLHDLLQTYGAGPLRLAMHMAVAHADYRVDAVKAELTTSRQTELPL